MANYQPETWAEMGDVNIVAPELVVGLSLLPRLKLTNASLTAMRSPNAVAAFKPPALTSEQQSVFREEVHLPGLFGAPNVRALLYLPPTIATTGPAYLHMHGGGYILGFPEISDAMNRQMAIDHGCVILSVDYRLAPETLYPGALEDCYAALAWLHEQASVLGVDARNIAVGGESAGGGHAAALTLLARDQGTYSIKFQLLDSPMLDDRTGSADEPHQFCGRFVWTADMNRFAWHALLGIEPGSADVPDRSAPARATDLSGLPPCFISVGAIDLFFEENLEFARRLARAGVPIELHVIPGAYHAFDAAGPGAPQVKNVLTYRRQALDRAFCS